MKKILKYFGITTLNGAKNLGPVILTVVTIIIIGMKLLEIIGIPVKIIIDSDYRNSHPFESYSTIFCGVIVLFLIFGFLFGEKRDIYIDRFMTSIPGVNKVFGFWNGLGIFTFQKKATKGQAVYLKYYNNYAEVLCYIMGTSKILKCGIPHYRINVPPAAAFMGGHLALIPCDIIDALIKEQEGSLPGSEDAFKINLSIGAAYPENFKVKETISTEEKVIQ